MAPALARSLRPVLLVGYGSAGLKWLRSVAAACQGVPLVSDLVRKGVIQFWAVGSEDRPEGDQWWNPQPGEHVDAVRSMLDRARRDDLRSQVPGLELHQVLLLERVSLYDPSCEPRAWLHQMLESARILGEAGPAASTAFEVDWLTLADGTWPNGKPAGEQKALPAGLISALPPHRVLYVDRQTAARGVVTSEASERVLARLAVTILSSDLGFPRREASEGGASTTLTTPATARAAVPVSVLTFVHRREDLAAVHGEALLRQILTGAADNVPNALRDHYGDVLALESALNADMADARSGGARFGARERRRRSLALTIARTFAQLAALDGKLEVKRLRDRIAFHRQRHASASSVAIRQSDETDAVSQRGNWFVNHWRRLMDLIVRVLMGLGIRRGSAGPTPGAEFEASSIEASLDDSLLDWEIVAGRLDALFDQFQVEIANWNSGRRQGNESIWVPDGQPYTWRLEGLSPEAGPTTRTSPEMYVRVAGALADQMTLPGGDDESRTLRRVLRIVAEQDEAEHARFVERQLQAALRTPNATLLRDAVRDAPLLVSVSGTERAAEIAWLTFTPEVHGDLLRKLEQTQMQSAARVLAMEDAERTVRVAFGEEVPWNRVSSLSLPLNAVQST